MQTLSINQLASLCAEEDAMYKKTKQTGPHCLALFNQALINKNEQAWYALYTQYQAQVQRWVYQCKSFYYTHEEVMYFVNEAFLRLWKSGRVKAEAGMFNSTGQYLGYLKLCTISAILDYCERTIPHWRLKENVTKNKIENEGDAPKTAENSVIYYESLTKLEQILPQVLTPDTTRPIEQDMFKQAVIEAVRRLAINMALTDKEQIISRESWCYSESPRQIYASYHLFFKNVAEVSQIKRNIKDRISRKLLAALEKVVENEAETVVFYETWQHKRSPTQIQAQNPTLFKTSFVVEQTKTTLINRLKDML